MIRCWNLADGADRLTLAAHQGAVQDLAVLAPGPQIASAGADGVIRIWAVPAAPPAPTEPPKPAREITAHPGGVTALAAAPDGASLVSAGADKTVRQWTLADGKQVRSFTGPADVVQDLDVSADGKLLAAGSAEKSVFVWPLAGQTAPAVAPQATWVHAAAVRAVKFSPDASRLAAAGDDQRVHVWDVAAGRELEQLVGHTAAVLGVAFAGDPRTVVSGSADKSARVWTVAAARAIAASPGRITDLALSADGALLASASEDNKVKLWNVADGKLQSELPLAGVVPTGVALRADKTSLAAGGSDGNVYVWPLTPQGPGQVVKIAATAPVRCLRFTPDGTRLAVGGADKRLRVFDPLTGRMLEDIAAPESVAALAAAPDGQTLLAAAANAAVLQPLALLRVIAGHQGAVTAAALTADGATAFSGGADKTVRQWNLADGKQLRSFAGATDAITGLSLAAGGAALAAGSADKNVYVWTLSQTGEPLPAQRTLRIRCPSAASASARTPRGWLPAAMTCWSASGTWPPARNWNGSPATPDRPRASRSRPTARPWSAAVRTNRRGSGP